MIRFIKENWVVLFFAIGTLIAESVHHLPFLKAVHSYAEYNVEGKMVSLPITWSSVVYYVASQFTKASLFGAFVAFFYALKCDLKESQPIAFALMIACSLWQIDELMYTFKVNTNVLWFESSLNKLLFVFTVMVFAFIIYKRVYKCRMKKLQ